MSISFSTMPTIPRQFEIAPWNRKEKGFDTQEIQNLVSEITPFTGYGGTPSVTKEALQNYIDAPRIALYDPEQAQKLKVAQFLLNNFKKLDLNQDGEVTLTNGSLPPGREEGELETVAARTGRDNILSQKDLNSYKPTIPVVNPVVPRDPENTEIGYSTNDIGNLVSEITPFTGNGATPMVSRSQIKSYLDQNDRLGQTPEQYKKSEIATWLLVNFDKLDINQDGQFRLGNGSLPPGSPGRQGELETIASRTGSANILSEQDLNPFKR